MSLFAALTTFLHSGPHDEATFDALAHQLFAYQFAHNAPYRRLCEARGQTPETVTWWQEIPTVPAAAFKRFSLTCVPEEQCVRVFHSSGTTGSDTSRHFLSAEALELYRTSLVAGFARALPLDEVMGTVALMPSPREAPHSSLSFMLETLGAIFFTPAQLAPWLRLQREPLCYFGTAFAFVHLLDATEGEAFCLPKGSIVIETGGFKGRSREISREELYALFTERLGVAPERCYSEYGMSELASQFYSQGVAGPKLAPPWLKTRVIDPVTGAEALPGEPGLLAHYDLANLNSVLAIQTEDRGIAVPHGGFQLLGRAPGAILRGCSLLTEELL